MLMHDLRSLFCTLLLGLCLVTPFVAAQELPTSDQIQQQLDTLAERNLPQDEQQVLKETLEDTLKWLKQRAASEQRLGELKHQLNEAPRLIKEAQRELQHELDKLNLEDSRTVTERYANTAVQQLETELNERAAQLSELQKTLAEANSQIVSAQTRPERAQAEISESQKRIRAITAQLKDDPANEKAPDSDERNRLLAEQAALKARIELLHQELSGNSLLQELATAQREMLRLRIQRLEQEILELQSLVGQQRREQSEQTVAELSREVSKAGADSLLAEQSRLNLQLSAQLLRSTNRLNELTRRNLETRQQLDAVNQTDRALEEQISVLKDSLLLSRILHQQKQALPQLKLSREKELADEIADIRLLQFELNQRRQQLSPPHVYVKSLLAQQPAAQVGHALRQKLLELVSTRIELLDRLNRELNNQLNEAITLQLNQKQLQSTSQNLRDTLEEQMFWIASNKPLDFGWFAAMPDRLEQQLQEFPWQASIQVLWDGLSNRPLFFLPLLLVAGALLWKRRLIYSKLKILHKDIGNVRHDSQLHTLRALLMTICLALPGTLLFALAGYALVVDGRGQNASLGVALLNMAQAWLVLYSFYRILTPAGVAELHFRWPSRMTAFLRKRLQWLGLVILALVGVVAIAEHQPAALPEDIIGIGVVMTCYLLLAVLLAQMLLFAPVNDNKAPVLRLGLGLVFTLLPLALVVAVGLGYYYTALKLSDRLIDTLYLLLLWLVLQAVGVRGLSVAARRLAFQRALAKRHSLLKEGVEGSEVTEEPALDMEQVNQQSLRLIQLGLFVGFVFAFYWVWADLLTVFSYLDNITLYKYGSGSGESATTVPISLRDVIGALVVAAITLVLARNLPGLLEMLVLSRLKLAQGSAYATTTLLSYVIIGVGFVSVLSTLGVSWDRLQWLVAALGVGLGFGLQEIFANFISGLIILFERPARIGDIVTIGNLSGTVSRIRIRATTITDFDRKEIIVPNKTFITEQLVNWSLMDTITRVTIKVGVAYGSDLEQVRTLLHQAAQESPRVLSDPEPLVYFLNFGESTLDHELRVHVRDIDDRNPTIDEINRFIDREFRKHGIEIAFRQLDIYVKNLEGQELQLNDPSRLAQQLADGRG